MTPLIPDQINLSDKQKEAIKYLLDGVTRYIGFGGAAGGAKTFMGVYWMTVLCLSFPKLRFFIGRNQLKQTRDSVLQSYNKACDIAGLKGGRYRPGMGEEVEGIHFPNGSVIIFLDLSYKPVLDPEYTDLGSREYTGGWIEESAGVHYLAFEVLKSRIGRWENHKIAQALGLDDFPGKILCTFNPKRNWVYETFYKPFRDGILDKFTIFIPSLVTDNPFIPESYIEGLKNIKDKNTRERLLHGNFDYDDDPSNLVDWDALEDMSKTVLPSGGLKYISADVARHGSDRAIIIAWRGWTIIAFKAFDKCSTTELSDAIRTMAMEHIVPMSRVIVDEDGVGGGVVDQLGCRGFINGSRKELKSLPAYENYFNLQSLCGFMVAEKIMRRELAIACEIDTQELDNMRNDLMQLKSYDTDKDGKLRLIPKKVILESSKHSPDWRDAILMRFYHDISSSFFPVGLLSGKTSSIFAHEMNVSLFSSATVVSKRNVSVMHGGDIKIWQEPASGKDRYIVVLEAGGVFEHDGQNVVKVLDRMGHFKEVVASWEGVGKPAEVARTASMIASHYDNATLVVIARKNASELGQEGDLSHVIIAEAIECYNNNYVDIDLEKTSSIGLNKFGFDLSPSNKNAVYYHLMQEIESKGYMERDEVTLGQLLSIERVNGLPSPPTGFPESHAIATAVAVFLSRRLADSSEIPTPSKRKYANYAGFTANL